MRRLLIRTCVLGVALASADAALAQPLPELTLAADETTVSGLSSGAYMAVQLHVAFSQGIAGAGIVAGGPYYCARGDRLTALNQCMQTTPGGPDEAALLAAARGFASDDRIDPLDGLAGDRVYLFSSTQDRTVTQPATDSARDFYLAAGITATDIVYVTDVAAGHAFLAPDGPNACAATQAPYINDCGIDQAGEILQWLYDDLAPPQSPDAAGLRLFDQSAFLADPEAHGMDASGYVYIPEACESGATCRLHIAFHGCEQTPDHIGDLYARTTGYNRWAEANDIVVLYPQAQVIPSPLFNPRGGNPKGCWDWWGYDDARYFARKGRQMAAVARMTARLGAPIGDLGENGVCNRYDVTNWTHWLEDRAEFCGFFSVCAVGSGEVVGFPFTLSTLYESPEGHFSTTSCE